MKEQFYQKLIFTCCEERVIINERMENHTSLHIGGEADYLVAPKSVEEIQAIISLCKKENMPYYVIGNGSNLLVSDKGYRGVIIKLSDEFSSVSIEDETVIRAQSGILLSKLAAIAAGHSLTGLEFASGIPGTLGGAVTMNAGAYDGEMKHCLLKALVLDENGALLELSNEELELGYRTSILQKNNYILLEAQMKLKFGEEAMIRQRMKELNRLRREKQPLDKYSAGSTFKRPEGHFAGKLISDCGLKGYQIGRAAVSDKHCGFVVNLDDATAKDFMSLIEAVIRIVYEQYGVMLEPEIKILGDI